MQYIISNELNIHFSHDNYNDKSIYIAVINTKKIEEVIVV